ncbi:MAG: hypothetical protein Q8P26_05140 [Candidatus Levybacteria bacterium]|nr:hypothetical protein [Candidatus Levybacteria bacterium]
MNKSLYTLAKIDLMDTYILADIFDDEIVYKYSEGFWDVKNIDGKWRLWDPEIKEIENPDFLWSYE